MFLEEGREGLPFEVFHRDIRRDIFDLAIIGKEDDVWMAKMGSDLGFVEEALDDFFVFGKVLFEQFDGEGRA